MIKVRIGGEKGIYTLDMSGHAVDMDRRRGDPGVCSACSAIAYMLLGWASNKIRAEYTHGYGQMHIVADAGDSPNETAAVWEAAEIGLRQIAGAYPEYVLVEDIKAQS